MNPLEMTISNALTTYNAVQVPPNVLARGSETLNVGLAT